MLLGIALIIFFYCFPKSLELATGDKGGWTKAFARLGVIGMVIGLILVLSAANDAQKALSASSPSLGGWR